jgi:type VI secretion system secreted protein Hcp
LKNWIRNSLYIFLGLLGFKSLPAQAAQDMFLCSPDLDGESQDAKYPGCIDVLAWSWGMSNSSTTHAGGGGTAGKVNVQDISLTKYIDKSSPDLMLFTANGKHLSELELLVRAPCADCNSEPYFTLRMTDAIVSSVSTGGSGGEDRLTENVSFNFAKVEWCYSAPLKDGSLGTPVCKGWDIVANTTL